MQNIKYEVRPVVGYEGKYSVSNTGQVFSHDYNNTGQTQEMKLYKSRRGYLHVILCQDGKEKNHQVHRLILKAFTSNPNNKPCVDHIDGDKTNNHVSNLRWCTHKENMNNPITRKKQSVNQKGEKSNSYDTTIYKFRNKITGEIFVDTQYNFYIKYNLDQGAVSNLVNGKRKSHKKWILV